MDLGTMLLRAKRGDYESGRDLIDDANLLAANCQAYCLSRFGPELPKTAQTLAQALTQEVTSGPLSEQIAQLEQNVL